MRPYRTGAATARLLRGGSYPVPAARGRLAPRGVRVVEGLMETRVCTFRLDPEGFVRAVMSQGARFDLTDARECVAATFDVAGRRRTPVLVDMRGVLSQTREAREYFVCAETAERLRAVALLVDSPLSRLLGNFFLRKSAHLVPTRLFTDEAAAKSWLAEHPA